MHPRSRLLWGGVALLVICAACAGSGSESDGDDDDDDDDPGATFGISFAQDPAPVTPGQIVALVAYGAPADGDFGGDLDGTAVELASGDYGRLHVLVPPLPAGAHTLTVTRGAARATLDLTIAPYTPIDAPVDYVTDAAAEIDAALVATATDETDPEAQAYLAQARADLAESLARLGDASPELQALLAYAVRAIDDVVVPAAHAGCPHFGEFTYSVAIAANAVAAIVVSAGAGPWGLLFVGIGAGALAWQLDRIWELGGRILQDCVDAQAIQINAGLGSLAHATLELEHDVAKSGSITSTWSLSPDGHSLMEQGKGLFAQLGGLVPSSWGARFTSYSPTQMRSGGPDDLELGAINAYPNVTGEVTITGSTLSMTFRFADENAQWGSPMAFTFELRSPSSGRVWRQEATLAPRCLPDTVLCEEIGCVDVRTSNYHCGACNHVCGSSSNCVDGECVAPEP